MEAKSKELGIILPQGSERLCPEFEILNLPLFDRKGARSSHTPHLKCTINVFQTCHSESSFLSPSSSRPLRQSLCANGVKAAHYDFDHCPREGGLRAENPPNRHFSQHFSQPYRLVSLWGWGKYGTLIAPTTDGREKIDLVPKFFPRPCPVCLFKAQPERSEIGNSGRKRSFPAKCAGSFGIEICPRVQWSWIVKYGWENADREDFWCANHLRVDNGRNRSVQPRPLLLAGITVIVK